MSRSPTNTGSAGATGTNYANGPTPGQRIPDQLLPHHRKLLVEDSGISGEMVAKSGARSVTDPRELLDLGFLPRQARVPGILFPILGVRGEVAGWMYRPDNAAGKRKYEIPPGQPNRLYVPPGHHELLGDPSVPVIVVEGIKKALAVASKLTPGQAVVVALGGAWNWRGKNRRGGKTVIPELAEEVALEDRPVLIAFDSDTWRKRQVRQALERFTDWFALRHAQVQWIVLADAADGSKVGADDFLVDHAIDEFLALAVEPPVRDRPSIQANNAKIHEIVEQAWEAVLATGEIYRRGGDLVEIDHDSDGRPYLAPINDYGLLYHLSASADFVAIKQVNATAGGQSPQQAPQPKSVQPPVTLARVMLSHSVGVPELRRIVPVPVLVQAGQLIREPGYDPDSGLYYAPGDRLPAVPDDPTAEQVTKARGRILFALSGFPLDGEPSRAHAVALMIEPFVRVVIEGPTPLHLVESPTQESSSRWQCGPTCTGRCRCGLLRIGQKSGRKSSPRPSGRGCRCSPSTT